MNKQKRRLDAVHRATFRSTQMCQCERCARPGIGDLIGALSYAGAVLVLAAVWALS